MQLVSVYLIEYSLDLTKPDLLMILYKGYNQNFHNLKNVEYQTPLYNFSWLFCYFFAESSNT